MIMHPATNLSKEKQTQFYWATSKAIRSAKPGRSLSRDKAIYNIAEFGAQTYERKIRDRVNDLVDNVEWN